MYSQSVCRNLFQHFSYYSPCVSCVTVSIDASFARSSFSDLSSSAPCLASRMCSRACCHPINAYRTRHFAVAPVLVALLSLSVSLSAVGRSVATNQTLRNCLFATCLSIYLSAVRDHSHITSPNFSYFLTDCHIQSHATSLPFVCF